MKAAFKVLTVGVMAAWLSACGAGSSNTSNEGMKIGVVDIRAVVTDSSQGKAIAEKLKKEFGDREKALIDADKAFQVKAEKFKKDSTVMAEKERAAAERDLIDAQRDVQRMQAELREDSGARQREEMQKFLDMVKTTVNKMAEKEKFDLIIHSEAVPYMNERLNVTKQVIDSLEG